MRILIKLGCSLIFYLLPSIAGGQSYFQKKIDAGIQNNFSEAEHVVDADNNFWVLGRSSNYANYLIKTDSVGDTLFVKRLQAGSGLGFSTIVASPDGGVYLVGLIEKPMAIVREFLLVLKLDKNGEEEWSREFTGERYHFPQVCLHNGELHIGGIMGGMAIGGARVVYLIKVGIAGNLISSDYREANNKEEIRGIAVNPAGFVILTGVTYKSNTNGNALYISADPGGTIRYYNDVNMNLGLGEYARSNAVTVSGNDFWITGQVHTNISAQGFALRLQSPFAQSGDYVLITHEDFMWLLDIVLSPAGEIIVGGYVQNANSSLNHLITKLNSDYSIKWAYAYGDENTNNFQWVSSLGLKPDNGITAAGLMIINNYYALYMLSADENGLTGCLERPITLDTATGNFFAPPYQEDSITIYLDSIDNNIRLSGTDGIIANKICVADSCKAGFIIDEDSICKNACITITDTSKNAVSLKWSFQNGTPATFNGNNPTQVCFTTAGSKRIKLVVSNSLNSDSIEKTVYVHPLPKANAGNDTTICEGEQIRLQGSGGSNFLWSPDDFANSSAIANPQTQPDTTIRYYLTVVDSNGCENTDSVLVSVIPQPQTYSTDTVVCEDVQLTIDAANTGFIYLWSTGAITQTVTVDTGKHYVIISNSCFADTSYYTITGKDCKPYYYIPSAFTPNGDGLNDIFKVEGENIVRVEMEIFNRWGEMIFKENSITAGWDGNYKTTACPEGVYIYSIKLQANDGRKFNAKGALHLLR